MAICHAVICVYAISVETSPLCPAETTTTVKTHCTYTESGILFCVKSSKLPLIEREVQCAFKDMAVPWDNDGIRW